MVEWYYDTYIKRFLTVGDRRLSCITRTRSKNAYDGAFEALSETWSLTWGSIDHFREFDSFEAAMRSLESDWPAFAVAIADDPFSMADAIAEACGLHGTLHEKSRIGVLMAQESVRRAQYAPYRAIETDNHVLSFHTFRPLSIYGQELSYEPGIWHHAYDLQVLSLLKSVRVADFPKG